MKNVSKYILPIILLCLAFSGGWFVARSQSQRDDFCFQNRKEYRQQMLDKMSRKLELNSEQRLQIEKILDEQRLVFKELKKELRPRFREIHHTTRSRIAVVLDERQRLEFEQMKDKFKYKRHGREKRQH